MASRRKASIIVRVHSVRSALNIDLVRLEDVPESDLPCVLAWPDPDQLLKRLEAEIDALPEPKLALTESEPNGKVLWSGKLTNWSAARKP